MTNTRKILAAALAAAALLTGCGGSDASDSAAPAKSTTDADVAGETPAGEFDCAAMDALEADGGSMSDMSRAVAEADGTPADVAAAAAAVAEAYEEADAAVPGGMDVGQDGFEAMTAEEQAAYEAAFNKFYDGQAENLEKVGIWAEETCGSGS